MWARILIRPWLPIARHAALEGDVPVIAYLCDSSLLPCQFLLHIYCTSRDAVAIRKWEKKVEVVCFSNVPCARQYQPPWNIYTPFLFYWIDAVKRGMSRRNLRNWTGAWRPQLYDPIYISQCSFTPIRPNQATTSCLMSQGENIRDAT